MTHHLTRALCAAVAVLATACQGDVPTPPKPPPAADPNTPDISATVAGVDANQNGVRDDVERLVDSFQLAPEAKSATLQLAASLQVAITASASKDAAYDNAQEIQRAQTCMAAKIPDFIQYANTVQAKTLNTEQRSRAWIDFEDKIGGQVFPEPQGAACK